MHSYFCNSLPEFVNSLLFDSVTIHDAVTALQTAGGDHATAMLLMEERGHEAWVAELAFAKLGDAADVVESIQVTEEDIGECIHLPPEKDRAQEESGTR